MRVLRVFKIFRSAKYRFFLGFTKKHIRPGHAKPCSIDFKIRYCGILFPGLFQEKELPEQVHNFFGGAIPMPSLWTPIPLSILKSWTSICPTAIRQTPYRVVYIWDWDFFIVCFAHGTSKRKKTLFQLLLGIVDYTPALPVKYKHQVKYFTFSHPKRTRTKAHE